jgi:hypothetical protein
MTSESIQFTSQPLRDTVRRERWSHIADTFGLPLSSAQLDELPGLSDRCAVDRFFPQLLDVEVDEVLWAANVSCAGDPTNADGVVHHACV